MRPRQGQLTSHSVSALLHLTGDRRRLTCPHPLRVCALREQRRWSHDVSSESVTVGCAVNGGILSLVL